jgi:hypothetical protein
MFRCRLSFAERRIAYFTSRSSSASYRSGLAKAASARKTTSLLSRCCRSISGSSSSSQPSALWTLPGRSLAARQSPFAIEQQQRMIAGGFEVSVVGTLLVLTVNRDLCAVHIQHDAPRRIDSFDLATNSRLSAASPARLSACVSTSVSQDCKREVKAAPRSQIFREPMSRKVGSWESRAASLTSSYPANRLYIDCRSRSARGNWIFCPGANRSSAGPRVRSSANARPARAPELIHHPTSPMNLGNRPSTSY